MEEDAEYCYMSVRRMENNTRRMTQNIVTPSSNLIILYTFAILETGHNHDNNLIIIYLHVSLYIYM